MTARTRRHRTAGVATAVVAALVLWAAPSTAGADTAAYATWTVGGGAGAFTGTMTVGVPGFPAATFSSNATTASGVGIQSGASTFLSAATPFGAVFGSSLNQPYANIRYATGQGPSTTTFAFAAPTPSAGWGFAVGDVDADTVRISATDAGGNPVPVAALGFEGTFNYAGAADVPNWNPVTGTLVGNVVDTNGASGWFRPTVPLQTLTFTFTVQSGFPIYQLWFAALGSSVTTTTVPPTTAPPTTAPPTTAPPVPDPPAADDVAGATGTPAVGTTTATGTTTDGGTGPAERTADVTAIRFTG